MTPSASSDDALFVYGTFLPGEVRWPLLRPFVRSWVDASTEGVLWDTGAGYPAATFGPGAGVVVGTVVRLDPQRAGEALSLLDAVEGEGVLYRRVTVVTTDGPAMAYEWMGATTGFPLLPRGWRAGRPGLETSARGNRFTMAANPVLGLYLNDHLAGATAGVNLARKLAADNEGTPLGTFMAELVDDIEADRATLEALIARFDFDKNTVKQAASWLAEKTSHLRFSTAVTRSPELSRLMEMETLSLGIEGKLALWLVLRYVSDSDARLQDLDIDTLIQRAKDQLDRLEPHRLTSAAEAFAPQPAP